MPVNVSSLTKYHKWVKGLLILGHRPSGRSEKLDLEDMNCIALSILIVMLIQKKSCMDYGKEGAVHLDGVLCICDY